MISYDYGGHGHGHDRGHDRDHGHDHGRDRGHDHAYDLHDLIHFNLISKLRLIAYHSCPISIRP